MLNSSRRFEDLKPFSILGHPPHHHFQMSTMSRSFRRFSSLSLESNSFAALRASGKLVDKTGAIADLLGGAPLMKDRNNVFFARPPGFGKSLTLSIAAEMLAAGPLPLGVAPWPGYAPADARALFGGLAVHERLLRSDPSLGGRCGARTLW